MKVFWTSSAAQSAAVSSSSGPEENGSVLQDERRLGHERAQARARARYDYH